MKMMMAMQPPPMHMSSQNQYYGSMPTNMPGPNRMMTMPMPMPMPMSQSDQMSFMMAQMAGPKMPEPQSYPSAESTSTASHAMLSPSLLSMIGIGSGMPTTKMLTNFNPLKMVENTKTFLISMKDLSGKSKATGVLKFFNENKGFGFFVNDADGKDVFFHFEDLKDIKISKDFLREAKNKYIVKFAFTIQVYYGKYSYSTKAVDIELLGLINLKFLTKNESLTN